MKNISFIDGARMQQFSIGVGDTVDINEHRQCVYQYATVPIGGSSTLECHAVGRFISFRRTGGIETQWVTVCEFVAIGHPMRTQGKSIILVRVLRVMVILANIPDCPAGTTGAFCLEGESINKMTKQ